MKNATGFKIPFILGFVLTLLALLVGLVAYQPFASWIEARSSAGKAERKVFETVIIDADGSVRLNDDAVASAQDRDLLGLRDRLKEQEALSGGNKPVVIMPRPEVSHERVLEVLTVCSTSGIRNVYLKTVDRQFRWQFRLADPPAPPAVEETRAKIEVMISIDADGSVRMNNEAVASARDRELLRLGRKLKKTTTLFGDRTPVILVPHPDVRLARISDVLSACSRAGARNVSLGGNWSVMDSQRNPQR